MHAYTHTTTTTQQHPVAAVRVRPLQEYSEGTAVAALCDLADPKLITLLRPHASVPRAERTARRRFAHVFAAEHDNGAVFDALLHGTVSARLLRGEHVAVLLAGESGAGKTHTLVGSGGGGGYYGADPGLVARAASEIFGAVEGQQHPPAAGAGGGAGGGGGAAAAAAGAASGVAPPPVGQWLLRASFLQVHREQVRSSTYYASTFSAGAE